MEDKLKTWHFGMNNDKLVKLVLLGKKTATTSLYEIDDVPIVGEEAILVFANAKKACITKTQKVIITEFKNIAEGLAILEGEGSFADWRKNHIKYFKTIKPDFSDDTKVIFEIFEVKKKLV